MPLTLESLYETGEIEIINILIEAQLPGLLSPDQITRGDYAVLDRGVTRGVVVVQGPFAQRGRGPSYNEAAWTTFLDLFQQYEPFDGKPPELAVQEFTTEVVTILNRYPSLRGANTSDNAAIVSAGSAFDYVYDKQNNGPFWVTRRLTLNWYQLAAISVLG